MTRFLLQSLAIPAIQVVFDLVLRALFTARGGSKWDTGIYLTGFFACWAFSLAFMALSHLAFRAGKWPGRLTAGTLAVVHTTLLSTNFFLFQFFGEYLFPGAVTFLTDPYYMMDYVRTFGGPLPVLALLGVWAAFYLCLSPWCTQANALRPWVAVVVLGLAVPLGGLALNKVEKMSEYRMPPDMVAAESLSKHFLRVRDKVWPLRPSRRIPVVAGKRGGVAKPRTVVIILNESMGTRGMGAWDGLRGVDTTGGDGESTGAARAEGMPRLAARIKADSGAFVVFRKAYTNSVATQVSMASLFAGVSPEESQRVLHCTPMLWDLAKAAGYRTAYFSSQRLRWASLSDFLLGQPIDSLVAREQTNHPPVNDMGIDDFHLVETLEAWLKNHPDEPLFVVWNTNALHVPYQAESEFVDLSAVPGGRFGKAQYLLDTAMARAFAALEKAGRFEDALIINTSDHGEDPEPVHNLPRINSYYEEYIRIPLWVKLPRSLRGGAAESALRRRVNVPVANIDIVPSLAAIWGVRADARASQGDEKFPAACDVRANGGRIPWSGENLFASRLPGDRTIAVLSTGDTRRWDGEGFGLVRGPWRVVLWPKSGRRLYNVDEDPGQTRNLWTSAPDSVMAPLRRRIEGSKWLKRIHDHHEAAERSAP